MFIYEKHLFTYFAIKYFVKMYSENVVSELTINAFMHHIYPILFLHLHVECQSLTKHFINYSMTYKLLAYNFN